MPMLQLCQSEILEGCQPPSSGIRELDYHKSFPDSHFIFLLVPLGLRLVRCQAGAFQRNYGAEEKGGVLAREGEMS